MKKKIAVIGSGLGGLTAANLLARKGHAVTVFEAHSAPGGYTAGFRRKGFYFESGTLSFESSSQVFAALKDLGVYDRLTFEKLSYRFVSRDYDAMPATYGEFKRMLHDAYPEQKEALDRYFRDVDPLYRALKGLMGPAGGAEKLLSLARLGPLYLKYRGLTLSEFTARYFPRGSRLYRTLSTIGYPDMSPLVLGGAIYTVFEDYWTIKEGFQALADALAGRLKEQGGELKLRAPVDGILTRGGAAAGVRCGGEEFPADAVIAACDYKQTFLKLLPPEDVPRELRGRIERAGVSEGIATVYLGLSLSNDALRGMLKKHSVMCGDVDPGADVQDPGDEAFFEKTAFMLHSPSLINPALAPEGKSSLMLQAPAPCRWRDNWGGGDREKYLRLKQRAMDALITRAAALFPGLGEAIEFKDAATPLTYERYTRNTDGATSAWSWSPKKKFYPSSMRGYVETPVRGLYVGSCWASQLGGVPGAIAAACACAKKIGG